MGQILSQEEFQILLDGITQEGLKPPGKGIVDAGGGVKPYEFPRADERLQGESEVGLLIERFADSFMESVSGLILHRVRIKTLAIEIMKFSNFIRTLPQTSVISVLSDNEGDVKGLVVFDARFVFYAVESLFGGWGINSGAIKAGEYTSLEKTILKRFADAAVKDASSVFSSGLGYGFALNRMEYSSKFASVLSGEEKVFVAEFDTTFKDSSSGLIFCISAGIGSRINAGLHKDKKEGAFAFKKPLEHEIGFIPVELEAILGSARLSPRSLKEIQTGDVIILDTKANGPVDVSFEGVKKFSAKLGKSGKKYSVQIIKEAG